MRSALPIESALESERPGAGRPADPESSLQEDLSCLVLEHLRLRVTLRLDGDSARLHGLGYFTCELDMKQAVLELRPRPTDIIRQPEAALKSAFANAPVQ